MIEENLHEVLRSIEESRAKRTIADAEEPVRLVAVTKNHGVAEMREAIAPRTSWRIAVSLLRL